MMLMMMQYLILVKLLAMDKAQGVRERITSLKQYISKIQQKIPEKHPQEKLTPAWNLHQRTIASAPPSEIATHLLKQIQSLTERIHKKRKRFSQHSNSTQQILKEPNHIIPYLATSYISKVTPQESLNSIVNKIENHQWKKCSLYSKKNMLIIVHDATLEIIRLNLLRLEGNQILLSQGLIKFRAWEPDYYVILHIQDPKMFRLWSTYFRSYQILSNNAVSVSSKWRTTNVKCQIPITKKQYVVKDFYQTYKINISKEKSVKSKKQMSVSFKNQSVYDEKQEKDNNFFPIQMNARKVRVSSNYSIKSSQDDLRVSLGRKSEAKDSLALSRTISQSPVKNSGQRLLKLEQQKKKLIEQGKFNIHWNQQEQKYPISDHQKQRSSIRDKNTSKKSVSNVSRTSKDNLKNSSADSKKDTRSNEIAEKKRHDSETRGQIQDDRSVSKGGKTEVQGRGKKYTDFNSQIFPDFSEQNAGSSTKKKQSIRRQVMKNLAKKALIQQEASKSSETKNKELSELSLKEKSQRIHFIKQENVQKIMLRQRNQQEESDESFQSSDTSKSTFSQMDLHELRDGIVLWKCSVNGWKPHQKKLYLTDSDLQICYCSTLDERQQKKFFIGDIISVEQGKQGNGIIRHFGNVDGERCLIITIEQNNKKKEKQLEFYLGDNEALESLKDFVKKLKAFISMKQKGDNEDEDQYLQQDL